MLLATHTVNTNLFTHNKPAKKFIAEMSDLGNINFLPLYDDACDIGLAMVNSRTRGMTRWHVAETLRDDDNDVTEWVLQPTPQTERFYPKLVGYQMIIFND